MDSQSDALFALLDSVESDGTVVSSVRLPIALRDALRIAVELGMDPTTNEATVEGIRQRLDVFAQRLALEDHYATHPELRPSLAEIAIAGAELDANELANDPGLIQRAADEIISIKPDADRDDVLVYASALKAQGLVG